MDAHIREPWEKDNGEMLIKPKIKGWEPELLVKTKGRLRMGDLVVAPNQKISVFINRGYNGKMFLGYCTWFNKKKYCMNKKDVEVIGRYE